MNRKERLTNIFSDTQAFYRENAALVSAVQRSAADATFYPPQDYPPIGRQASASGLVTVSARKTFEAAMQLKKTYPGAKITVLNFASATNPGGGVRGGSGAQEESLCRCSTLYPTLDQRRMWDCYYQPNREAGDPLHTDACIYSPGVVICKTDDDYPVRLREADFVTVDVITCAAPNLRTDPANVHNPGEGDAVCVSAQKLYKLHLRRAKHILHIAAAHETDVLVLGAFGCGAFRNDPQVVARAYADALREYARYFRQVDFAIYCREWETENYNIFRKTLT